MPNIDDALQERLEAAMEAYDHALGVYRCALAEVKAAGVSWEDFTDLTGCSVKELRHELAEHRRTLKLVASLG